jgi:hypothetical protein
MDHTDGDGLVFLGPQDGLLQMDVFDDLRRYDLSSIASLGNVPPIVAEKSGILIRSQRLTSGLINDMMYYLND